MVTSQSIWNRLDSDMSTSEVSSPPETTRFSVYLEPTQHLDISEKTERTFIYNKSISGLKVKLTLDKLGRLFITLEARK